MVARARETRNGGAESRKQAGVGHKNTCTCWPPCARLLGKKKTKRSWLAEPQTSAAPPMPKTRKNDRRWPEPPVKPNHHCRRAAAVPDVRPPLPNY